ncbi:MAG: hypothetical protein OXJ52_08880 [Oligoflexia bacterium]|nr:hypothetical protein [Oligoflexia bacterium]
MSEFPNPHLPLDHEKAIGAIKEFQILERKFNRTHKSKKLSKLFGLFSWLG